MHFCDKDILAEVIIDFWWPVPTPAKDPINSLIHYSTSCFYSYMTVADSDSL